MLNGSLVSVVDVRVELDLGHIYEYRDVANVPNVSGAIIIPSLFGSSVAGEHFLERRPPSNGYDCSGFVPLRNSAYLRCWSSVPMVAFP